MTTSSTTSALLLASKEAAIVILQTLKLAKPDITVLEAYDTSPVFKHLMDAITKAEQ